MDEPTAVLAPQEIEELFRDAAGDDRRRPQRSSSSATSSTRSLAIADRITVMRRGRVTAPGIAGGGRDEGATSPG